LGALAFQTYSNWHALYINDASTDDTLAKVENFIKERHMEDKIRLINNETRQGAMGNIYKGVHMADDWDVIVIYDGDDWFGRTDVFEILNRAYQDDVWLTYGSYEIYPSGERGGSARQLSQEVIAANSYRQNPWSTSHLRTFYAWLFKCIKLEDLQLNGAFFAMTYDQAMMHPMLELSKGRSKYIPEILYIYNMDNPINDHRVDGNLQLKIESIVRSAKSYEPLDQIPEKYLPRR
jgi:glycosyltransferase involved in cell wall biosynthesis